MVTDDNGHFQLSVFNGDWLTEVQCAGDEGLNVKGYDCVSIQNAPVSTTNGVGFTFIAQRRVPLEITTTNLEAGAEGTFYSSPISASGGSGGYTWTLLSGQNSLPTGMSFSSDERGAGISGVPETNGTFPITIQVGDDGGQSTQRTFSLVISGPAAHLRGRVVDNTGAPIRDHIDVWAYLAGESTVLQRTADTNGNFVFGVSAGTWILKFDSTAAANRGLVASEFTTVVTDGVDQNGILLVLPRSTARITGSVKNLNGAGLNNINVSATTMVNGTNYTVANATTSAGNFSLKVMNGTWTVSASQLNLDDQGYQSVSATNVTVPPTNAVVNFVAKTILPEIKTALLANGAPGVSYSAQLVAQGGFPPYTWAMIDGALPSGMTFSTNGLISGTTTSSGVFTNRFQVTDSASGSGERTFTLTISAKVPFIFNQPASQSVFPGAHVGFTVSAVGASPLRYQWRFKGANISGATASVYVLGDAQLANQGNYSVIVSNSFGTAVSSNAFLTVKMLPTITTQPQSKTVYVGTNATLSVVASGTAPLFYQWRYYDEEFIGATNSSFVIPNVQTNNAGNYSVVISNAFGVAISSNAHLTVNLPVNITSQPESISTRKGVNVAFSVVAEGTPPLRYQWKWNGTNIVGATTSSLAFNNVQPSSSGDYRVVVSNGGGPVTSSTAHLQVYTCGYALSANVLTLQFTNLSGTVDLVTSNDCAWSISNTNDWFTVDPTNGSGGAAITISVTDYNTNAAPRIGDFKIAGLPVKLVQLGAPAPADLAGTTIRFAGSDYGAFLFVTRRGTNTYLTKELTDPEFSPINILPETGIYTYEKSGSINGVLRVGSFETILTFESAIGGRYTITDTSAPDNFLSGQFVICDSKMDLNEDGWTDLLWQKTNGPLAVWHGSNFVSTVSSVLLRTGLVVSASWKIVGQYDFNNDGHTDLFWQHDTGKLSVWHMSGEQFVNAVTLPGLASNWRLAGMGDFDSDGQADFVWQRDDRVVAIWFMNGENFRSGKYVRDGQPAGAGWTLVGVNDFNHDRQPDLVWQHDDGRLAVWNMAGATYLNSTSLGTVAKGWRLVGFNDFDRNGEMDILWQHADGRLAVWYMNGLAKTGTASLKKAASGWLAVGPK